MGWLEIALAVITGGGLAALINAIANRPKAHFLFVHSWSCSRRSSIHLGVPP